MMKEVVYYGGGDDGDYDGYDMVMIMVPVTVILVSW